MHYTLCDSILDLYQNSVEANSKNVIMDFIQSESSLIVNIKDDGKGMDSDTLNRVKDPFYTDGIKHKNRKVGLGIPFIIQTAEMTDGSFNLKSVAGKGTELNIVFNLKHWDTPPMGSIVDMLISAMSMDGDFEFVFNREDRERELEYTVSRAELIDVLGDLTRVTNMILLKEFIASQELDN
ncbi:MAG: sensor histidine kinase [Spirochaetales bacterium]|nr:sensor histidine kinase [Spirochaetales bacterium]